MWTSRTLTCVALLWLTLASGSMGQAPTPQPSSLPSGLVYYDNKVFFHAEDAQVGRTLRVFEIDTGLTKALINIEPGAQSAKFEWPMKVGAGFVFFAVRRPEGGVTVFRSDGSEAGTIPLKRLELGHTDRFRWVAHTDRYIFFDVFGSPLEERGLWRSDGTTTGTIRLNPEQADALFETASIHASGDVIAASMTANVVLRSDGTLEGTRILINDVAGVEEIALLGDTLFMQFLHGSLGGELGFFDADTGALMEAVDTCPGPCGGIIRPNFFVFGDRMLFAAEDGQHGRELWISDGTAAGTQMLKDLNPGASGSDPYRFTRADNKVYFTAIESRSGRELWVTDGTAEGTELLKDIFPGPQSSEPYAFSAWGQALFFTANDGQHGDELWYSPGHGQGTMLFADIYPGPEGSSPYDTIATPYHIYFSAEEPNTGRELWRSSNKNNDVSLVADVWSLPFVNPGSNPIHLTPAGDKLFFVLNDLEHGAELWVTEGDPDDARLVKDIFPGPPSSAPHNLTYFNGLLYFAADNGTNGVELWRSDGTDEGTGLHANLAFGPKSSAPRQFTPDLDRMRLYFVASDTEANVFWINVETGGVSRAIHEGTKGPNWMPQNLQYWNNRLFFTADDGIHGEELWVLQDDTVRLYRDFINAPVEGVAPDLLTPLGQTLYYSAEDDATGVRILDAIHADDIGAPLQGEDAASDEKEIE